MNSLRKGEPRGKEQITRRLKLSVVIRKKYGVPFEEGLLADGENRVIASNKRMNQALVQSEEWRSIVMGLPCWTGTMTGYKETGERLYEFIEYVDPKANVRWIFPVPKEFRREKDAILVAEHPDYFLERDGIHRIIHAKKVSLVRRFPAENGWYFGDHEHDIPSGDEIEFSNQARYLWRIDKRVGPVARGCGYVGYYLKQGVGLNYGPSNDLGVIVETK